MSLLRPQETDRFIRDRLGTGFSETIFLGMNGSNVLQSFTAITGSGGAGLSGGSARIPGTWYHGAWTFDGISQRLYLDGAQVASGPATGTLAATTREFLLAANNNGASLAPSEFFDGRLEDVRIYNRALGPDVIATIFATKGTDGIFNGLLARYPLLDSPDSQTFTRIANLGDDNSMAVNTIPSPPIGSDFNITRGRSAQLP